MLAAILVAALIIARTCGEASADVSKEQAVEIAKERVDFEPTDYQVRLIKQGVQSREVWLVGLERSTNEGELVNATSVLVDANTGDVIRVEVTR
jgi:predicted small secreted protein